MVAFVNRAKMTTSTTGTGTLTLVAADLGFQTFSDAGLVKDDVVSYVIEDSNDYEIGRGIYDPTLLTLTRSVIESSNSNAALNLSGSAKVYVTATAKNVQPYASATISLDQTLTSDIEYVTGSGTVLNDGVILTINNGAQLLVREYAERRPL